MTLNFFTAGESHGPALIAILEGFPSGLEITAKVIDKQLQRRQAGFGAGPRMKLEEDRVQILGGVMAGRTTGAPLALLIENLDHSRWCNREVDAYTIPRPGHVDLAGVIKYGYDDIRPALERASARETAARVAVGSVCKHLLEVLNVHIGGYVVSIGEIQANLDEMQYHERFEHAEANDIRCPDDNAARSMRERIRQVMQARDTLGGVIEVVALGVPVGLGSHVHWERRLEARLGMAMLSVPAIKGVEIGPAFENARLQGTSVHDALRLEGDGIIIRPTDRSGGTEGGISTGQPLVVRVAMKPIATTLTPQKSVDLVSGEETETKYERSDFCPVPRAVPVLEAMMAYTLADALLEKLGGDSMNEVIPRYQSLCQARLSDISIEGGKHIFWPE